MARIEIIVEVTNPGDDTYYEELPEGWETWDEDMRTLFLNGLAADYVAQHVGSAVKVVDE